MENTRIISAAYESSDTFDPSQTPIQFYRMICHSSYEEGSFVRTELWLPKNWNGRFLGLGNGGMAGGFSYTELLKYTQQGYATAQTDLGTSLGMESGIQNSAVWKDFGWRATHGMTVLSKELIVRHYGKKPDYSYFLGCSTGGQQAISEAQRFPQDYNGIIAGVPANNRIALHTYFLWNHIHLTRPRSSAEATELFSAEEIRKLTTYATEYFQPGSGFIPYPWKGHDTITGFLHYLSDKNFSDVQLRALKKVYDGPVDPVSGKQIYNGMPPGSETYGLGMNDMQDPNCPHFYPFYWCFGADYDLRSFDFSQDYQTLRSALCEHMDANLTDLSPFMQAGGKLIAYSGSADPGVPYPDAQIYYERVMSKMGGYEKTASFFRYFLFPGKDHGSGGAGSNREWGDKNGKTEPLDMVRKWCEEGIAPETLTAARVESESTDENSQPQNIVVFAEEIYPYGSSRNPIRECTKTCEIF